MRDLGGRGTAHRPEEGWQRLLETAALLILLSLAVLRPLVLETYDSALSSFDEVLRELEDPTPIRTLGFDLLILAAACLWLLARALGHVRRFRWTGIELGTALIALAAIVSSVGAGQRRLAFNASFDWLCSAAAAIVLTQLLRAHWQRRLLLGAVLATACVQALQCYEQNAGFDDTWAHYQTIKEQFWREQGVTPNSSRVDLFEQRMKAREAGGFFAHSNVAGSYLAMCGLAGLGVAVQRWRAKSQGSSAFALLATAVCAGIGGAIYLTGSRGAMLSAAVGVALWAALTLLDPWMRRHRTRVLMAGWICVGAAIVAAVIVGLSRDSLPGASLTFRWQYWTATAEMVSDHPWAGVGRENFGRHYTQYKPIEAPEEISNPHNLFVQATAEWGILGLVGLAAMLFGGSIMATRAGESRRSAGAAESSNAIPMYSGTARNAGNHAHFFLGAMVLWLVVILLRLPLIGSHDIYMLYYASVTAALAWAGGLLIFGVRLADPLVRSDAEGRTSAAVKGASFGLLVFVLHDLINFATYVPAAAYTAFSLFAFVSSARYVCDEAPLRRPGGFLRWGPFIIAGGGAVLLLVFFVPAIRANRALVKARKSAPEFAVQFLEAACEADPLDPTPFAEKARLFAVLAASSTNPRASNTTAAQAIHEAVRRDPFAVSLRRLQRRILVQAAAASGEKDDWEAAIAAAKKAVELYPASPQDLIELADTQLQAGEALSSPKLRQDAIDSYNRALGLDSQRPEWEWLRRLRPHEVDDVESKIDRAKAAPK